MKGITILWVFSCFTLSICRRVEYLPNCALEGDDCLGDFQCCSAMCYSRQCAPPNCLNDGQMCASFIGMGQCCSGYCGIDFRCHHRGVRRFSSRYAPLIWDRRQYADNYYG